MESLTIGGLVLDLIKIVLNCIAVSSGSSFISKYQQQKYNKVLATCWR